jgi:hypothetical protein
MDQPAADGVALECPVCRAGQSPRDICRRCGADLALFVRALESRRIASGRLERAITAGNPAAMTRLRGYLAWLGGGRIVGRAVADPR